MGEGQKRTDLTYQQQFDSLAEICVSDNVAGYPGRQKHRTNADRIRGARTTGRELAARKDKNRSKDSPAILSRIDRKTPLYHADLVESLPMMDG